MGMGRKRRQQESLWTATQELPRTKDHVFYYWVNRILGEHQFDAFAKSLCEKFYAVRGWPGVPPGVYFRMLLVDYCEGLALERGIAWRCTDSLRLQNFLGVGLDGDVLDHSTLSRIRHPIDVETHAPWSSTTTPTPSVYNPLIRLTKMFSSLVCYRSVPGLEESAVLGSSRLVASTIMLSALLSGVAMHQVHAQNNAPIFNWQGEVQVSTSTLTIREGEALTYNIRLSEQPAADGWWVRIHVDGVVYIDGHLEEKGIRWVPSVGWEFNRKGSSGPTQWRSVRIEALQDDGDDDEFVTITHEVWDENSNCPPSLHGVAPVEVQVTDDETASTGVALSVNPMAVSEGAGGTTVTVRAALNGAARLGSTPVKVAVGKTGDSATEGTDYETVDDLTVMIPVGLTSATETFTLTPTDDDDVESDKTVTVSGTTTASGITTVNPATLTIVDDDVPPDTIELRVSPASVAENAGETDIMVTAAFPQGSATLSTPTVVNVTLAAATAQTADFTPVQPFNVTIPASAGSGTATFQFTPNDDTSMEGSETVTVSGTTTASGITTVNPATLTIVDDDAPPDTIELRVSPASVAENAGETDIMVTAAFPQGSATLSTPTVVNVTLAAATAQTADFTPVQPFNVTIPASAGSGAATFQFTPNDDTSMEGSETVTVSGTTTASGITTVNSATLTIIDNETPNNPPTATPSPSTGGGGGLPPPSNPMPSAPRNLVAIGGDEQVTLTWDAPEDDDDDAITDYEYRIDGKGRWISIGSTDTTYTVTGLVNGTEYTFEVRAVNRNGTSRASNRAEATTIEALDFAHFANGAGSTSDFVFVNVSPHMTRPTLYFYDQEGQLMDPESVVDVTGDLMVTEYGALTVQTEMEPLGELTISTHGRGDLVAGSVRVVSGDPIGGFLRFDLPGIGVAGVGASPPVRDALFPARRQAGGIRTAAALHNLGEEAITVSCRLMSGGMVLEAVEIDLEANGQEARYIEEVFTATDTSDFVGSVRCTAPGRFTGIAVELDAGNRIFTTLPVVPVARAGGGGQETVLYFAHFANGSGTTSDLVFVNVSPRPSGPGSTPYHAAVSPSRPALYFYDKEGNPIAAESVVEITGDLEITGDGALSIQTEMEPLGELTISTHGRGALVSGSVKVVSEGPIGGVLRYALPGIGVTGVGASPPVRDALFPVRQEGGLDTAAAIHNLTGSDLVVTCRLMKDGAVLEETQIPLAANGQEARYIEEMFTFIGADRSDFVGSVRCTVPPGEAMFTGVAVELDAGNRIFTTLPVVPVERAADSQE